MRYLKILAGFIISFFLISCTGQEEVEERERNFRMAGEYVSEGYFRRNEGYDWIKIDIIWEKDDSFQIEISSREDIKQPTCTYEGEGTLIGMDTLRSEYQGKGIIFRLDGSDLIIEMEDEREKGLLYYFCSGGASLRGRYMRLK